MAHLGHRPARQTDAGAKTPSAGAPGFTLVEVLVALMILGITFGAVLGGMATSINTSDLHRQQAQVQAVLASAVEKVKSPETDRVACATPATYLGAARSVAPAANTSVVPPVEAWLPTTIEVISVTWSDGNGGFGTACYDDDAHEVGGRRLLTLQRIEIRVTHPGGRVNRTLAFVKGVG